MNKRVLAGIVFCVSFCGIAAAQVLGKIEYMEGTVDITRDGAKLRKVDIGTPIENLDLIKTSADGLASITFDKASGLKGSVQIVAGSTAVIRQDQINDTASNEVQLITGSVNLKVKRLAGMKSSVQVRTPSSVLGVRGTEFVVSSFNGSTITACKEGEVFCSSWSEVTQTRSTDNSASAVPGTMVEILEAGNVNTGSFPEGNFEDNWNAVRNKWKNFNVELFTANPVNFMNQFVQNWTLYSGKVEVDAAKLRSNAALSKWLEESRAGNDYGTMGDWIQERPSVMKDLIALRPDMILAMFSWYRLQELIPLVPQSAMNRKLVNGQTVKAFISQFNKSSATMTSAVALFHAAEKQYMLRNDGLSPFSDF